MEKIIEIYVQLMDEPASRPTQAVDMGNGLYKLLPIEDYDLVDEKWEFLPGSIVRCEKRNFRGEDYLLAVEQVI